MADFILEEQIENVIEPITKKYLQEVISSYRNGNYRACISVLYTTVIFDLLQKIIYLKNIYNDNGAEKILNNIKKLQEKNPKSPIWEENLIEDIYKETKMISLAEKEELLYLKKERNYAAHPIITINDDKLELKDITKETAIDLIRKAFEIVFLRDVILAKNIFEDVRSDANEYYKRINKPDRLEKFLNEKYFKRMTQERKDALFKDFWKFVFSLDDNDCNENRESNYWGLVSLYNENKDYYRKLIIENDYYHLKKLSIKDIETLEKWSEETGNNINENAIYYFKKNSRIMYLIKFFEYNPELYKSLNDGAKNILRETIDNMYIQDNVIEKKLYQYEKGNSKLFKEQVRLKADTMFLSDDSTKHFDMICKMISNCTGTMSDGWVEISNYCVLDDIDLEIIFHQSEYRGCTDEFIKFLIDYCTGAFTYDQASYLFSFLKMYKKDFKKKDYYLILIEMNYNSQFFKNNKRTLFLKELEKMYKDSFDCNLIEEEEEKYLYKNLYEFHFKNYDYKLDKILNLIEKRAIYYKESEFKASKLKRLIFELLLYYKKNRKEELELLKKQKVSLYPNILFILKNCDEDDAVESFNKYFEE